MTIKDHINNLQSMIDDADDMGLYDEDVESLKYAIKVLEKEPVLDKIRAEIEQIEINGHIRDAECFNAGINTALNVINKYRE